MSTRPPRVFISYAWEADVKEWVPGFALRLRNDGVDARIDQWETVFGDQLTEYMERSIRENDFVLIICTPLYKSKADERSGGVGYEGHIITAEIFQMANHRKFIPILLKGNWNSSSPSFLHSKFFCDLRSNQNQRKNYEQLLSALRGKISRLPPIRLPATEVLVTRRRNKISQASRESTGAYFLTLLRDRLPGELRTERTGTGATVFIDSQRLQRVKVYQYRDYCKVRVRCSRGWGLKNCRHGNKSRNAQFWLPAIRIEDHEDVDMVVQLYDTEWGNCEI